MKKLIQPLLWFLVLTSTLALASGFALSTVSSGYPDNTAQQPL
jgi:hypothetical protein